jgi:hypothetical protein
LKSKIIEMQFGGGVLTGLVFSAIILLQAADASYGTPIIKAGNSVSVLSTDRLLPFGRALTTLIESKCPAVEFKDINSALDLLGQINPNPKEISENNDDFEQLIESIANCRNDLESNKLGENFFETGKDETLSAPSNYTMETSRKQRHPVIQWIFGAFSAVKSFFRNMFSSNKIEKRSIGPTPPGSIFQTILDSGIDIGSEGKTWSKRVMLDVMRIYGHSCPSAGKHVQAFLDVAKELLGYLDESSFAASYVRTFLDDEFMQNLSNCMRIDF